MMIYLDNSATTKPYREVVETFQKTADRYFGNPSSLHHLGIEAERLIEKAREVIASNLGVDKQEVLFTSGGTEGNNLAIKGIAWQYRNRGRHVITTTVEHPSSTEAFRQLEELGFEVTYLPVNDEGRISLTDLKSALRDDTILVSVIHVNNEIGTIQPIEEIGELLSSYPKTVFHVDHVQGASKVPLAIKKAKVDLCTLSAHKLHGLKGTGVLTVRKGVTLAPLFSGGGQERNLRSGTENVPGIVAMAKAIRLSYERLSETKRLSALRDDTIEELSNMSGIHVNTPKVHAAPHIVNFSVKGIKPEALIHSLSEQDIYVSTKSACSSKNNDASAVILAIGGSEERAKTAIRLSFSFATTEEELTILIDVLKKTLDNQRRLTGGSLP